MSSPEVTITELYRVKEYDANERRNAEYIKYDRPEFSTDVVL
jgi:hypothetical protein